ncbi:uncharacterized protein CELE_C01G12.13 [Caenorhabditis elegans]|uniref:Uncharacterized protein n=1 Tax=Caenorhabditis elegans TaxID=6239 RepID=Q4ZGE5_CAEEL|nr:Uncharacterized protein CELE_C01G12.13 [Caenorhabditis elegans]CAI94503.1 Uncharacterized protein CELE_C01G12.13 [Caenorhabditis elegans]|eukprot:NP_001021905.1 Uncharacterized protein CELE_C01G12.13 [Caenorhabditis elegans]
MYQLLFYNVICAIMFFMTITSNCLKGKPKEEPKKPPKVIPIRYETDPAVLEKERKMKIAENREKMRKKREKQQQPQFEKAVVETVVKREVDQKEMKLEDVTQPSASIESNEQQPSQDTKNSQPSEDEKEKKTRTLTVTDEDLGNVKLVENDPDGGKKLKLVKKQAREQAKQKELEEQLIRQIQRSESRQSPDDTMKNVSSIQFESQNSHIQRKKQQQEAAKTVIDTVSIESQMIRDATLIEPKSNELYVKELTKKILEEKEED